MEIKVKDILKICNAKLYCGDENIICSSFNKDTRTINNNDTYIGIKGANFDGNSLYKEAFSKGANACILEKDYFVEDKNYDYNKPIILVNNSKEALKNIASYIRDNSTSTFIAVTGSVGKTSTKDMIYNVLSTEYNTLKTIGNYNNDIGLPLSLMRLKNEKMAVLEMGMNNLGEISYLSKIAKPHIAVITNVGTAHIGNLGSRENILKAKLEIKDGLDKDGTLIINNDNDLLHDYYLKNKEQILTIGIENKSDIMAEDIKISENKVDFNIIYENKRYEASCPVPSISFVYNSLVSFAVGMLTKVPFNKIIKGINTIELTSNRLEIITTPSGIHIINDCYNASLDSMKSSIDILAKSKTRKIAVLGTMLELGSFSKKIHEEVGEYLAKNNIDILITVGDDAKFIAKTALEKLNPNNVYSFNHNDEAINKLKEILKPDDTVLIKASNGLKFIEIVNSIKNI